MTWKWIKTSPLKPFSRWTKSKSNMPSAKSLPCVIRRKAIINGLSVFTAFTTIYIQMDLWPSRKMVFKEYFNRYSTNWKPITPRCLIWKSWMSNCISPAPSIRPLMDWHSITNPPTTICWSRGSLWLRASVSTMRSSKWPMSQKRRWTWALASNPKVLSSR